MDVNKLDANIKLIASTACEFARLEEFRRRIPHGCKEQIESIGPGFSCFEIRYKQLWGKPAVLPGEPRQITYDKALMRVYYNGMHIIVPSDDKPVDVVFVSAITPNVKSESPS